MARPTLDIPIRDSTPMEAMEMVTPMAIDIMVETRETTPTVTTMKAMETTMEVMVTKMEAMDIRVEAMDNTVLRRICRISSAI
jgi:vacuolar-type H+-ATPase subunit D/Vma8